MGPRITQLGDTPCFSLPRSNTNPGPKGRELTFGSINIVAGPIPGTVHTLSLNPYNTTQSSEALIASWYRCQTNTRRDVVPWLGHTVLEEPGFK